MNSCIGIITSSTLAALGLRTILEEILPRVEVLTFSTFASFQTESGRRFVHYFISEEVLFAHAGVFDKLQRATIVLCDGQGNACARAGFKTIDITLPEKELVAQIIKLHESRHHVAESHPDVGSPSVLMVLSERERQILALIVKGLLNKEIADLLNISPATVIFHRNNICSKLSTRSIGRLTIIAVLSGLVGIDEI